MDKIAPMLTPAVWLMAPTEIRHKLVKDFGLVRSTTAQVTNYFDHGVSKTKIESDGHTIEDLKKVNVETMQEYLGFKKIDPKADLLALFQMCCEKAEVDLMPVVEKN